MLSLTQARRLRSISGGWLLDSSVLWSALVLRDACKTHGTTYLARLCGQPQAIHLCPSLQLICLRCLDGSVCLELLCGSLVSMEWSVRKTLWARSASSKSSQRARSLGCPRSQSRPRHRTVRSVARGCRCFLYDRGASHSSMIPSQRGRACWQEFSE